MLINMMRVSETVRRNPLRFWLGLLQSWVTAFATASTAAALPVTLQCITRNCGVDTRVAKVYFKYRLMA